MHGVDQIDTHTGLRFAELLCSRLCHELVSPVSAINNGVELIRDLGADAGALELIAFSGDQIAARLRALRLAYGAALDDAPDAAGEARKAAAGYVAAGKASLIWDTGCPGPGAPRRLPRVLLNAALIASDALPRGGSIVVEETRDAAGSGWSVFASGARVIVENDLIVALRAGCDVSAVTPRTVQGLLCFWLAERAGLRLRAQSDAEGLALHLTPMAK
jgi:histidine phosphotransferase ChpT